MSGFVAALPMYDWPEVRAETDAVWTRLRDSLRGNGVDAPERLARRNADLPPVPGGIRDADGVIIAPDPASLPPDEFDLAVLWRHPDLLLAQTCWGPMELGLADRVQVVRQPDYSAFEGGQGEFYSSAILMRREASAGVMPPQDGGVSPPSDGRVLIPLGSLVGQRLAFNSPDSMSGVIALRRDLEAVGFGLHSFPEMIQTGSHRESALAVAKGRADVCAVDCRSWQLFRRIHPGAAAVLSVVGWTSLRKGLPFIASARLPAAAVDTLRAAVA